MGVYPGGAFQEEEEDADVKRMKVQWWGWVQGEVEVQEIEETTWKQKS